MNKYKSLLLGVTLSSFIFTAEAVDMVAQPVVGDTLNGVAVAFQTSPLPQNLKMLKTAKLSSRNYLIADNNGQQQYFQIYYVDANNNGSLEYVITQMNPSGIGPSQIIDAFTMNNNQLNFLGFNQVAAQSLGVGSSLIPCKNWYCNLASPPFIYQGNFWFMRFTNSNGQTCQYLWKNNQITNQPQVSGCIGNQAATTQPNPAAVSTKNY